MDKSTIDEALKKISDSDDRRKFGSDIEQFIRLGGAIDRIWPFVSEWKMSVGTIKGQYFLQDLQVAKWIFAKNPRRHLDVGSRIDGFVAHVASFRQIEVLDIRPLENQIDGLRFVQCDLTDPSPSYVNCTDSVSCLHALEHFGLGRYGDKIDPEGHLKGFASLVRMIRPGGTLYLSFPVGGRCVEFNAQRVFDPMDVFLWPLSEQMDLVDFRYVGDDELLHDDASPEELSQCKLPRGLGLYVLRKRSAAAKRLNRSVTSADAVTVDKLVETMRSQVARNAAYWQSFGIDSVPSKIPPGMNCTHHTEAGIGYVRLANGRSDAHSYGPTQGYSIRLPDAIEAAASGNRVRVNIIARAAAGCDRSRFALAYSTNEVGNSRWRWQDAGQAWSIFAMDYAVPVMQHGQGDFVGILPDAEGQPGTDFCYLSINVAGTSANGTAMRENANRKINVDDLKVSESCQLPLLLHFYAKYLRQTGIFVEVGAYDGESFSNSSCLADAGWTGYYIEPIPEFARKCALRHSNNNVKVFNVAISDKDELVELNLSGPLTTASTDTLSAYKEIPWSKEKPFDKKVTIQATALDNFLKSNDIERAFDLLIVDVEGFEQKVFGGLTLDYWSPKMIIVELNDYHSDFISTPDLQLSSKGIRDKIIESGYMQVYADAINTIFVHESMRLNY